MESKDVETEPLTSGVEGESPVENDEVQALEEEGEVAADYIEEFLDICDLDGDIDIDVRNGHAVVAVLSNEDSSNLDAIADLDVVAALQELTRLAAQQRTGRMSRLILDIQRSRERRTAELEDLVTSAARDIHAGAESVPLPPMSSYDRKIVHDLARDRELDSESEGMGRTRHVVLRPVVE